MSGLTRVVVGRASAVVSVLMLGLGVLLIVGLGSATHQAQADDQLPEGYDSTRAAQLSEQLPDEDSSTAVVLFTGEVDRAALGQLDAVVKDLSVDRVACRTRTRRSSPARTARPRSASSPSRRPGPPRPPTP